MYFAGKFDAQFATICGLFGDKFVPDRRLEYFDQFVAEFKQEDKFKRPNPIAQARVSLRISAARRRQARHA